MDKQSLRAVLANVLTPNTNNVKEATAKLKKDYYTSPKSLLLLLQILISDDTVEIRQLAATEARKLVGRHWSKTDDAQKSEIRNRLLQSNLEEKNKLLRHSLSRLIGVIAKIDISKNEWTDLPAQLLQGAESDNPQAREVSTYLLFSILDELEDDSTSLDYRKMFSVFSKTIQDRENPEVAVNTVYAISKMAVSLDSDGENPALGAFQKLVPNMVKVLLDVVEAEEADQISRCFEAFQTILEAAPKVLDSSFQPLILQMAHLAGDTDKDEGARVQALNFLISALLNRKMKFQSLKIGDQLVDLLFKILAGQDESGDIDEDDMDLAKSAMHLLTLMADQLPPQQIAAPVVTLFKQYAASSDSRQKQAAITALAQVVEGTPDFIGSQLPQLIPAILNMLNDPHDGVRESAILGCRDIAEYLPEVMAEEHEKFLNAFVKNLSAAVQAGDPAKAKRNQSIAANCCLCIDGLVLGLEKKDIGKYMPELVPNLTHFFTHSDVDVQKASISAVGSIASVAEEEFLPYFEQCGTALSQFIELKDSEDQLELRAVAVDMLGNMAGAVGPDAFQPFVPGLIRSSQEALHLDFPRLKETTFMLWGSLAKAYKEKFQDFLEPAVVAILESLAQEDDADITVDLDSDDETGLPKELSIGGKKIKIANNELGDIEDDDEDDDDDGWGDLTGISAVAEEKEVALEALADIFTHVGKAYGPYYEKTLEAVLPLLEHSWDPTRRAAIGTLFRLYASLWQLQPEAQSEWEPGLPIKSQPSPEIGKIRDLVMTYIAKQYPIEDDPLCLIEMNSSLAETLRTCGPFLVSDAGTIQGVVEVLVQIVSKKHACQVAFDDEEDDDELDEHSEDDWSIIGSALDTVAGLAKALGPSFGEVFKIFQKLIVRHASATSSGERTHTVGTLADIIKGMKSGVTPYTSQLLKVLLHRLSDEDGQVKSNAAYAIGMLVENSDSNAEIKKAYPAILGKLEPLLQTKEARQLDNAAGCVSRMITKNPEDLPIDEILPALVNLLPLKEDYEENVAVWPMIVFLYKSGHSTVQSLTPQIVPALEKVLGEPEEQLDDETREILAQLVQYLSSKQPGLLQQYPGLAKAQK